jgi:hypothetical protein
MGERSLIGIHGLNNKPAAALLQDWGLPAIREGLQRNAGRAPATFPMTLIYWADTMYDQRVAERDDKEPYFPAPGTGPFPRHARSLEQFARWAKKEGHGQVTRTALERPRRNRPGREEAGDESARSPSVLRGTSNGGHDPCTACRDPSVGRTGRAAGTAGGALHGDDHRVRLPMGTGGRHAG